MTMLGLYAVATPLLDPQGPPAFVEVRGASLFLEGSRLRIVGGNSYGILSHYLGLGSVTTGVPNSAQRLVDASAAHLRALRFWLDIAPSDEWFSQAHGIFSAQADHADYFGAFDRLLADARATRILLIPVFVSAYDQWTKHGNDTNFWTVGSTTNVQFKAWVTAWVTRYRNEPQIAWWELANEPNHFSTVGLSRAGHDQLVVWAKDMVALVKGLDANHLVEGGYNHVEPLDMASFDALNSFVDIASSHIYDEDLYALQAQLGITGRKEAVNDFVKRFTDRAKQALRKPIVWGEFNGNFSIDPNNPYPEYFLEAVYTYDGDGALIWSWEEGYASGDAHYVSRATRPAVVASLATWSDIMHPPLDADLRDAGQQPSGALARLLALDLSPKHRTQLLLLGVELGQVECQG
jgi:hypothetical protein